MTAEDLIKSIESAIRIVDTERQSISMYDDVPHNAKMIALAQKDGALDALNALKCALTM